MNYLSDRFKKFYTHGGRIIDMSDWDVNISIGEMERRYGWEGAMAYGNLIYDELNGNGPGIREGDIFVDLGANIGLSSLVAERSKASRIYCIEPDMDSYNALCMNRGDNWVLDNIAIGESEGFIEVSDWPESFKMCKVRCITFDQYVEGHNLDRIDFLKVDIEGFEKSVFNNVKQSTWDVVRKVFIEYHGDDFNEVFDYSKQFINRGFHKFEIILRRYQSMIYIWKW